MNFDEDINRYGSNSLKYDFMKMKNKPDNVLPMWVADMDFKCSDEILNDLHKKVNHGIFGYSKNDEEYFNAIKKWYLNKFDIELKQEWLVITPVVGVALAQSVKALTNENDYVLINNPVYYTFSKIVLDNKRQIISSDLVLRDGHYEIDFSDFENKIKQYNVKMFLLCSPHNPIGRVWTKDELDKIVKICSKYKVFIVSDEIHCDFAWNNNHICLLKYENNKDHIILCTSPTKTFNLAGLQISNIFIPDIDVRKKFQRELWNSGYSLVNIMGLVAGESAYKNGENWLNELKKYIIENIKYTDDFLKKKIPKIKLIYPEGTYLLWLDFNEFNLSDDMLEDLLLNKAKLWLDSGKKFGKTGSGFQRMNVALSRAKLKCALESLEKAFKDL